MRAIRKTNNAVVVLFYVTCRALMKLELMKWEFLKNF